MADRISPKSEARLNALGQEVDRPRRDKSPSQAVAPKRKSTRPRQQSAPGEKKQPSHRRFIVRRAVTGSIAVLLVLILAGAGYVYYLAHDLNRQTVNGLSTSAAAGSEAGSENILMVGSTSRCSLKVQNIAYGLCSQGVNGVNSDVVMILHADPTTHRLALLSLPRDLFIPNARSEGANKIDAGLYEGISQVVASVQQDFGIPIQHAVSLNFDQFANVVDALGGINMSFPVSVFDAESGLNIQAASCVHLNGTQSLAVVRARHLQYGAVGSGNLAAYWPQESLSDLARIRRDHEFLRVLASSVAKQGLSNPVTDLSLINSLKSDLTFDQSWSINNMVNLVLSFHSMNINKIPQLTFPVSVVIDPNGPSGDYVYKGANYGQVEFPAQSQGQASINTVLGISRTINSMTGQPLPTPSAVKVSVMNGSGVANQASTTSSALHSLGFDVVGIGDVAPVGDVSETVVYYGSKKPSAIADAQTVMRSLSGAVVMGYGPSEVTKGATVTVVTGSQLSVNSPASPTSKPASTTTTVNTTKTLDPAIGAPTTPTQTLQPWDPRACPAGTAPTAPQPNRV